MIEIWSAWNHVSYFMFKLSSSLFTFLYSIINCCTSQAPFLCEAFPGFLIDFNLHQIIYQTLTQYFLPYMDIRHTRVFTCVFIVLLFVYLIIVFIYLCICLYNQVRPRIKNHIFLQR